MADQNRPPDDTAPPASFASTRLEDVLEIAERALWNPAHVPHDDIQRLAAAVVAYLRRTAGDASPGFEA